jgi:hypothetical protein
LHYAKITQKQDNAKQMVEITPSIKEYSRIKEKGSNSHCSPLQGISVFYVAGFFLS